MNLDEAIQKTIKKFEQDKARTATATRPAKATPKPAKVVLPKTTAAQCEAMRQGEITWTEFVRYIARRDNVTMAEAGRRACKEFPGAHPVNKIRNARRAR